jgi:hypothetical protein
MNEVVICRDSYDGASIGGWLTSGAEIPLSQAMSLFRKGQFAGTLMGRAGIEPATLGLKVDLSGFGCFRLRSEGGMGKRNRVG